jgi:nitronate monooxygenase
MTIHELLGIELPVIQAPMAGVQDAELAATISNAGGLGSLPCAMLSIELLEAELHRLTSLTDGPFNLNFFCHDTPSVTAEQHNRWRERLSAYFRELGVDPQIVPSGKPREPFGTEALELLETFRPKVISFHFGLPDKPLLQRVKSWGSKVLSSATTVEEAVWLEEHGADAIIAQGFEAGGHRGCFLTTDISTQTGTLALVPQICDAVSVPVIAAGGISSPQAVKAAMTLGAAGVQMGTVFLLCPEARTSPLHRAALTSEAARHTALTNVFTGRPARSIVNRLVREVGPMTPDATPFPTAAIPVTALRTAAESTGNSDFSPLWSGQNAADCCEMPAADLLRHLASGT